MPGVAITEATRQRVREAARSLGYHPHQGARGLAGGKSFVIGLVVHQSPEQAATDAFLPETIRGIAGALRSARYRILVEPISDGATTYAELVRSRHADGLIVSGPRVDATGLAAIEREGFPVVIHGHVPGLDVPSVDVDNQAGARVAVEHLIALGHRRIGCVTNAPLACTAAAECLEGYRAALRDAGIELDPALVVEAAFDARSGHVAMSGLLARGGLDAVFVASDVVALGAVAAIREAGLVVPDDVAVVGFDDIPLAAYFDPPLTTVHLPAHDLGTTVGTTLLDRIAGRPVPDRTLLPTELVVRSSSRPTGRQVGGRAAVTR